MEQPGHARVTDIGIEYFITKYFKELGTLFQKFTISRLKCYTVTKRFQKLSNKISTIWVGCGTTRPISALKDLRYLKRKLNGDSLTNVAFRLQLLGHLV